jgi:predicted HAD superfamily Cof-like phosphohydrolase
VKSMMEQVAEFNLANSYESPRFPTAQVPPEIQALRMRLIAEEVGELFCAMHEKNLTEVADALCDLLYVVFGTAHAYGLGPVMDTIFNEVHASNMSKDFITNADGRKGGLKGPRYFPPKIAEIIDDYIDLAKKIDESA